MRNIAELMMLRRRTLLAGGLVLPMLALPRWASAMTTPSSLRQAARDAWLWALPLIEIARLRQIGAARGGAPNQWEHRRKLAGPDDRDVTAPNNETLYSSAFLDLRSGPVMVTIPATGERYFSLALMDFYSNNFAVLGTRTIGGAGGRFTIAGPTHDAPPGSVRSPTPWVWALARTLVRGPDDIAGANIVQDGLRIEAAKGSGLPPPVSARRSDGWPVYFSAVDALMRENGPPATDEALLRSIAPLGLARPSPFEPARFSSEQAAEIAAGVSDALADLTRARRSIPAIDGWQYPRPSLGDFGQDYAYRAAVAFSGLAALPVDEAMYMQAIGADGSNQLDTPGPLCLRFAADSLPPVDGFWALSMYEVGSDGKYFLTRNPINRYAIGDRTPGLVVDKDGSLSIWVSRTDPGAARRSNWLPAPTKGKFRMSFRAYLPRASLRDGSWRLPPLLPV